MTRDQETRVVLADRPGVSRTALARLVSDTPGVALVAKVSRSEEIEPAVQDSAADVVIVDDRLLRDEGWLIRDVAARLIVVGVDDDPGYPARARRLGAETWIAKDRADALLPLSLRAADAAVTPRCRRAQAPGAPGAAPESSP